MRDERLSTLSDYNYYFSEKNHDFPCDRRWLRFAFDCLRHCSPEQNDWGT